MDFTSAIGLTRERLEAAYAYLLEAPPLGLAMERHSDELSLASSGPVAASVERYLNSPRPMALSNAALHALAIVATGNRQPGRHRTGRFGQQR